MKVESAGNIDWMDSYGEIQARYLNPSLSDHCPVIVNCTMNENYGGRLFKFPNYLAEHHDFDGVLRHGWGRADGRTDLQGIG